MENQSLLRKQNAYARVRTMILGIMAVFFCGGVLYAGYQINHAARSIDTSMAVVEDIREKVDELDLNSLNTTLENLSTITENLEDTSDGLKDFSDAIGSFSLFGN